MRKLFLFIAFVIAATISHAQTETFDLITYTVPKGWKKEVKENVVSYSLINNAKKTWCQIGIIKSTVSKGTIDLDFKSEWTELVVKPYNPTKPSNANGVEEANGWKIKAGASNFTFNNAEAIVLLTTASGFDRCVSIVATTNSQEYLTQIETFISSVDLKKPEVVVQGAPEINSDQNSITGIWKATTSDNSNYRMKNGIMNYIMRQYSFNADGNYTFTSKLFDPLMDKILLGKESGTYQITGTNLVINPKRSVLEAWSKKDGADKWGKLLTTQNISLEKVNYQFTKHYFSGIQQWSLVLQADQATQRDGPFSNNTTFKNAWYYGPITANSPLIELPGGQQALNSEPKKEPVAQPNNTGFAFTTTNFDDGWTGNIKEDWIELKKGDKTVLMHFPTSRIDLSSGDSKTIATNAWNTLVAPRYSNLENFAVFISTDYQRAYFVSGNVTDPATRKKCFVILFKKEESGWLEFICGDKNDFAKTYGLDIDKFNYYLPSEYWDPLKKFGSYNRFAVAASDLKGKWTNKYSGILQYVNSNTGADAGMNTHSSSEVFEFTGNKYNWELKVASGFVGNIKFAGVKSSGQFSSVSNWQVAFSDIEGKPKVYNAYFSCIKGGRLLWFEDSKYPTGYTSYGRVE